MTFKFKQQGFTIVELLIVIVVIGILAALVITTFTGIQKKARDTERTTDIKALHSQLEGYYAQEGSYPAVGSVTTAVLKGLDADALLAPNPNGATLDAAAATIAKYQYVASPATCTTDADDCVSYDLNYVLESAPLTTVTKNSLN